MYLWQNFDIKMLKTIENNLIQEFKERTSFSREELFEFFRFYEPDLKEGTFGWRIFNLKNKKIIKPLMRGLYTLSVKPKYKPLVSNELLALTKKINEKYVDVKYCIWDTSWLNEFSQHQASKRILIFEVERDFLEAFFYDLKDAYRGEVFLSPDEKEIKLYVAESTQPIVVKRLVTRSPINERKEKTTRFYTPSLEKILVDLFVEEKLFFYYQGTELIHIFENALKKYHINFTKLLGYAKRREKADVIKHFLNKNISHLINDSINV